MKTFTTYAEKKAKQILNLLQGYTKGIRMTAILILLLMGVNNAWAWDLPANGYIYFVKPSQWSTAQFMIGHSGYSIGYSMTSISNTRLYYYKTASWGGYGQSGFIDASSTWGGESNAIGNRKTYASHSADVYTSELIYSGNMYGLFTSTYKDTHDTDLSFSRGSSYTICNKTQTIGVRVWDGSAYSAPSTSPATVTASTYNLNSATASQSASTSFTAGATATGTKTVSAAYSATVSLSYSNLANGYTFVGWYDSNDNEVGSSYEVTGTKTVYARFKENTYTVTVTNDGHGTTTPSGAQSNVGQVTGLSIKATPAANYEFVNWTITSGSGSFGSATSASTTFKPTSTATIQANFRSTATHSLTVVAGAGIASVTGSKDPVTLGSTYAITATPKTGYTFSTWTANPAANATFGSATTANTTVTVKNGSVTVTATATETLHAITVQSSDDNHGTVTQSADKAGIATSIAITATPKEGYQFVNWTATSGITIAAVNSTSTTVTATAAGTVTANFEKIPDKIVYLKPNSNWKQDGARFAAYAFGGGQGNAWYDMIDVGCSGEYYYCEIPAKYTSVIFVRMNPANAENKWNNNGQGPVWNQTGDLTIEEGKVFTITDWGGGSWGTYTTPTYDITINITGKGSIVVGGDTYTGDNEGKTTLAKTGVALNTSIDIGAKTPAERWSYKEGKITIGKNSEETLGATHVICGPTIINVTFEQNNCYVTFDLNGGTGNQPAQQEVTKGGKVIQPTPDPTRAGYTFDGWYKEPACTNAWNFSTDVVNQDITLYAKWEEIKYNLSTRNDYDHGTPDYAAPTKSTDQIGVSTTATVTASNTLKGYTFVGWDLANCVRTDGGAATATSITVRYDGNGGEALVVAKYEEDLTSNYVVRGGAKFGNTWGNNDNKMTKLSGHSYEDIVYFTVEIDATNLGNSNAAFQFKIYDTSNKWWGFNTNDRYYNYNTGERTMETPGDNIELRAKTVGSYTIKVDYSDPNNLKLTVNFPSSDLYIVGFNGDWATKPENKFTEIDGIATISKLIPAGDHQFKLKDGNGGWRTMSATPRTITRSNHTADFSDFSDGDGTNTTLKADVAGVYTFTYNIATNEFNVTYPALVTLSDGVSEAVSSSQTRSTLTSVPGQMVTATPTMDIGANGNTLCWKLYDKDQDINNLDETVDVNFISLGNGKITFELPKVTGTYYLQLTIHAGADCSDETLIETIICPINVSTENTVFFQDESGKWKNVYVYFYGENGYWNDTYGSGATNITSYEMTRINGTNIFYYNYGNITTYKYIAFTDHNEAGNQWFDQCQVVYRGDFNDCVPLYVMDYNGGKDYRNQHDGKQTCYYRDGYWTTYMGTSSGYWLHISGNGITDPNHEMTTTTVGKRVYTHTVSLNGNNNHYDLWFGGCNGTNYGVESNMTVTNCTEWNLYSGSASVNLYATASGDYTFILYCNPDGHFQLSVEFPVAEGDFQLVYDDEQQNPHPSDYIRSSTIDGKSDTVSMYIRGENGTGKTLKVQRCTGFDNGNPQWETLTTYNNADFYGLNLTKDTVYNFHMKQTVSGNTKTIAIEGTEFYSGKYYVRTKAADGGWDAYATESDNQMTYTEYSSHLPFDPYTHYFCKWVDDSNKDDVSYTVACDYAKALSDTLEGDNYTTTPESHALPEKANVRFTYDNRTNGLKRAYLTGASDSDFDDFLKLAKTKDGTTMKPGKNASDVSHVKLQDEENWVYATEIYVTSAESDGGGYSFDAMLTAVYPKSNVSNPEKKQYFFAKKNNDGTYAGETLIAGTDGSEQLVTIRYDFKTNRLMRAWKPSGNIDDEELPLSADILLIREGQNAAEQLVFSDPAANKMITNVKTIFGALEFKYDNMVGKLGTGDWNQTSYHYCRYYVSFPFDVRISEIFGAGNYGEDYIIQKYNGTKRAEIGWFAETETFWETMDKSEKLNKYEGYCVMLNRTPFNDGNSHVWKNKKSGSSVYLYFPSASHKEDWTINAIGDVVIAIPEHKCNIDRYFTQDVQNGEPYPRNHKNTDSHWNMVGTPLFQNATAAKIADGPKVEVSDEHPEKGTRLQYVYDWVNTAEIPNGTAARKAWGTDFEFKAMHSYLIQYAGQVTFQGSHIANHVPAAIAARRVAEEVKNYTVELQLDRDSAFASRTYVELQENAVDSFLLNEDMYMGSSSPIANLYTYAGAYDVAANVLSVNSHIVPVGVQVKKAGTYTFSMTTPFDGTVTLIDYQTCARTNLGWSDYTVTLEKGTINDRFALEINIQHVSTDVEGNTGHFKGKDAVKFLHNGILYIKKGDAIYDARGSKVSMSYEL